MHHFLFNTYLHIRALNQPLIAITTQVKLKRCINACVHANIALNASGITKVHSNVFRIKLQDFRFFRITLKFHNTILMFYDIFLNIYYGTNKYNYARKKYLYRDRALKSPVTSILFSLEKFVLYMKML